MSHLLPQFPTVKLDPSENVSAVGNRLNEQITELSQLMQDQGLVTAASVTVRHDGGEEYLLSWRKVRGTWMITAQTAPATETPDPQHGLTHASIQLRTKLAPYLKPLYEEALLRHTASAADVDKASSSVASLIQFARSMGPLSGSRRKART